MTEVTSGDYHKNIKETDLTDDVDVMRETCLTDWSFDELDDSEDLNISMDSSHVKETSLVDYATEHSGGESFNDICDAFSKFLNENDSNDKYTKEDENIRETDLTGSDDNIRETDLTGSDEEEAELSSINKLDKSANIALKYQTVLKDTVEVKIPGRNNESSAYDSGLDSKSYTSEKSEVSSIKRELEETIIRDYGDNDHDYRNNHLRKKSANDGDYNIESVRFQDVPSDFFETDCENMEDVSKDRSKESEQVNINFQSIGSEYFKNETTETDLHKETGYFQDIESDFFEDEEDDVTSTKTELKPVEEHNKRVTLPTSKPVPNIKLNKTASMSNTLLRSTISELERALTDSNTLLATRDEKIQELRTRNTELKKNFNKELENSSQMKLLLSEKAALVAEKDLKISELYKEIKNINDELDSLRTYKLNNIPNTNTMSDNGNTENSICTEDDNSWNIYTKPNTKKTKDQIKPRDKNSPENSKTHTPCRYRSQSDVCQVKTVESKQRCHKNKNSVTMDTSSKTCLNNQDNNKLITDEKVSQNELHAHLRMKFMRDAFFYYMIGFHPDEQINAILAILEYGDKRQDLVLEAHNLKKVGKKFKVTKVSSRGYTFVQEEYK